MWSLACSKRALRSASLRPSTGSAYFDVSSAAWMAHPELLDEASDLLLDQMARFYAVAVSKKGRTVEGVREHQRVLRHCREVGVEVAFASHRGRKGRELETLIRAFFLCDDLSEARGVAEQYPEILECSDEMIERIAGRSFTPEGQRQMEERRQLFHNCRDNGVEIAFAFL